MQVLDGKVKTLRKDSRNHSHDCPQTAWTPARFEYARIQVKFSGFDKGVELANLPQKGGYGQLVLQELIHRYPKDALTTLDFDSHLISRLSGPCLALQGEEGRFPPPDQAQPFYQRLRVKVRSSGVLVEVANIPATALGVKLFLQLANEYRGGRDSSGDVFQTTDYGYLEFRDVDLKSVAELNPDVA